MKVSLPLHHGLSLEISDQPSGGESAGGEPSGGDAFPTRRLQKGLLLLHDGEELAEEAVGFGVPILKRGAQTIFPGGAELVQRPNGSVCEVTAAFQMSLAERLARPGGASLGPQWLYAAKDSLAALHRRSPRLRGPLTATSVALRRAFGWVTTFEESDFHAVLRATYTVHGQEGKVHVALDMTALPGDGVTEVVVMNEQGARSFDRYRDADGTALQGQEIGTWDEVAAATAAFVSTDHGVAFSLGQVGGARLHRGRELIGSRVAWAGFGYSLPPTLQEFHYDLRIENAS